MFYAVFIAIVPVLTFSRPAAGAKLNGNVEVSVDAENKDSTELDIGADLKLRTKRKYGFRAYIKAEGSAVKRDVHLEDVYIDYKFSDHLKASVGYSKKILGLEWEAGKKRRLTIHRSPVYRKMEALGLVGRQLNLRLDGKLGSKSDGIRISGALGGDSSRDYNLQLSLKKLKNHFGVGLWSLMECHRIDDAFIPVFSEVLSLWYESAYAKIALEMVHGIDAQRTEFQEYMGNERTVHFIGPKLDFALHCQLAEKMTLSPILQTGFIIDDVKHAGRNTVHVLAGLQFKWHELGVSFNIETFGVKENAQSGFRNFHRRSYYGQIIYFF